MEVKKVVIIGLGNCGSQVANLAEEKYPELFDCIYINTSDADLAMVKTDSSLKYKVGEKDEIEGSGKNRTAMKKYLKRDIKTILMDDKFQSTIKGKKYGFIIASAAGGTGSGSAPVVMYLMKQMFPMVNFILVTVLPQLGASLMEHGNEQEFLKELYETLGNDTTYMVYDNETTTDMGSITGLIEVNKNIVEDIRILTGVDNFPTPYESIDAADMESLITTPGRLLVSRVTKGLTEKSMEDNSLDEVIIKNIKSSCHAETDRNKKVVRWGIITYFTEQVNTLYSSDLPKLEQFLGTPKERFNHNAINNGKENLNFLYLIASGLSPINDRVTKTEEKIEELRNALAEDDSNKFILAGEGSSYDVMAERKKQEKKNNQTESVSINAAFDKFM